MSNPLYNILGNNPMPGNMGALISQLQQFKQTYTGDARAQVQQMLNSGKITQAQYNQAAQLADQLMRVMKP